MENEATSRDGRDGPLWTELLERAKDDPELAEHLSAAKNVLDRYRETLQRLADS